jgi:DNA (cytosine-5)-methyltransferase 1
MRPIAIDLFAGAGGMSLGFEQAGFEIAAAVEIDPIHCAVHSYNFPDTPILAQSVSNVSAAQIRLKAGIGNRRVDCVFGGPPCQGFSMMGQRILDDPRNQLVLEFVRLVKDLDARTFVFENVKGLTVGQHKKLLHELVGAFEGVGYEVRQPWTVLNANQFGVPQSRERLFLYGAKCGERMPLYPEPLFSSPSCRKMNSNLPIGPSCNDALADIPDCDSFESLLCSDSTKFVPIKSASSYASELRCESDEAWHAGYKREWDQHVLTSSMRTGHSTISKRRFFETKEGEVEPISRFYRLSSNGVSNTLRAGTDGARGAFTSPRPIHFKYHRCITVREMARLHGFPDWFRFHATKWHGARQIGNAVPPPLARAVAKEVLVSMGHTPYKPIAGVELGDTQLLTFNMSQAANYFDIIAPNNRRDRKSGSTKRSQLQVEFELESARLLHA